MRVELVDLSGPRFDDGDRRRVGQGLCAYQTGYGLPHMTFCETRLSDAERRRGSFWCREHERDAVDDGRPALRLRLGIGLFGRVVYA